MNGCRIVSLPKVTAFDSETLASGEYAEPKRIPLKTLEEAAEMVEAAKAWLRTPDADTRRAMLDETADVLQTVANMCAAFGISDDELEAAMAECERRNRQRGRMGCGI